MAIGAAKSTTPRVALVQLRRSMAKTMWRRPRAARATSKANTGKMQEPKRFMSHTPRRWPLRPHSTMVSQRKMLPILMSVVRPA